MSGATWLAGVVAIGALSPGPNNLLAMESAVRRGIAGTLPAIGGVVAGTLLQVAVLASGMRAANVDADAAFWLILIGGAYLAWLGARLIGQGLFAAGRLEPTRGGSTARWARHSSHSLAN